MLAITPTTAVVRVGMEKHAIGTDYTDFHTLIKLDGPDAGILLKLNEVDSQKLMFGTDTVVFTAGAGGADINLF